MDMDEFANLVASKDSQLNEDEIEELWGVYDLDADERFTLDEFMGAAEEASRRSRDHEEFGEMDLDQDERVSLSEFKKWLNLDGFGHREEAQAARDIDAANKAFTNNDMDEDGLLEYEEFVYAKEDYLRFSHKEDPSRVFYEFDTNHNYKLEEAEFRDMLAASGLNIDDRDVPAIISRLDWTGDFSVDFDEYNSEAHTLQRMVNTLGFWRALDVDESGDVSGAEIDTMKSMCPPNVSPDTVAKILGYCEFDGDVDVIHRDEFFCISDLIENRAQANSAFPLMDTNADGNIDLDELKAAYTHLDLGTAFAHITHDWTPEDVMNIFDDDRDGALSSTEFSYYFQSESGQQLVRAMSERSTSY
eukprot:GFYU01028685.1.p1 GENE.GFYU01028685.1~~GFYU01028685.1.p1  ORF type:complete len:360 (-),score=120.43 GFYU01028685.1:453-1532(-)